MNGSLLNNGCCIAMILVIGLIVGQSIGLTDHHVANAQSFIAIIKSLI